MTQDKKLLLVNVFAFVCAVWFLLAGWLWIYFFNVIFVFPIALVGVLLWRRGRKAEERLFNKIIGWMLLAGLLVSLGFLVALLTRN